MIDRTHPRQLSGMPIAGRAPSIVKQGYCVACIAPDVDPWRLE